MPVSTPELLDAIAHLGSMKAAAEAYGMKYDAVQKRIERYKKENDLYPIKAGKSILYDGDGEVKMVWSKGGAADRITIEEAIEQCREAFKTLPRAKKPSKHKRAVSDDLCLFMPMPDLHMGLRAWKPETGQDWDLSIAGNAYRDALSNLTHSAPHTKKAIVLGLGDLLHADNYHYTTTNPNSHHVVDVDGRFPKMIRESVKIMVYAVEMALSTSEYVEVVVLRGNHDGASAITVQVALEMHYADEPRVSVWGESRKHWADSWGKTLLFATHGDTLKFPKVAEYVAAAHPVAWGLCTHRYAFTGHFHQERVKEQGGLTVEILPSPAAPDAWTTEHGFCSGRSMQARVFHTERGEVARIKEPVGG